MRTAAKQMAGPRSYQDEQEDTVHSFYEGGRRYGKFKRGAYLLPVDDAERVRLDLLHAMIKTARESPNQLLHAPRDALMRPPGDARENARVLDLGCGTGLWVMEMAEEFPHARCVGVDINAMGTSVPLSNLEIQVPWDYEHPWPSRQGLWDVIHLQMGLGAVQNWHTVYTNVLRHLVPGSGYFESVEIDWQPRCDDGTLAPGMLTEWWEKYVSKAYEAAQYPITYNSGTARELEALGFRDVEHRIYQLPLNPWATDTTASRVGHWFTAVMSPNSYEGAHLRRTGGYGMEALSLAPLTRVFGWSEEDVQRLCRDALRQACNPDVHVYNDLHIYWARAPWPHESRSNGPSIELYTCR